MSKLITSEHERVSAWVAERCGCEPWTGVSTLGWERDGSLVGGVVITGHQAHGCASMHAAGEGRNWITRPFLFATFDYIFNQLDLKVLINTVGSWNLKSMKATQHLGFTEFARFPMAWDGEQDLVLFELRRENCRWIGEQHGR